MIRGLHAMFYSSHADELRTFLRDKIGFRGTDVGGGWLIFETPEADLGVHPTEGEDVPSGTADISFYCDDIAATVRDLKNARRRVHERHRGPRLRSGDLLQGAGRLRGSALPAELPQMTSVAERRRIFRELHARGCFVIPNPWDVGSARVLAQLGFQALATTSCGFAWSVGCADNHVTLDQALTHLEAMSAAVDVPVSADFEGGFGVDPAGVAVNVASAAATGIAGLSIEDSTHEPSTPLFDFSLAVDRIRAARQAIDDSGTNLLLTARTEGFIAGRPDLQETIRRLTAFAEAGRRLPVCAGDSRPDGARHDRRGGCAEAGQRRRRQRLHDRLRARRDWRPAYQCRRLTGTRRLDGISSSGDRDRRARHLHESGACSARRSTQPKIRPQVEGRARGPVGSSRAIWLGRTRRSRTRRSSSAWCSGRIRW